jgi:NADPH-dependent 2,4-dienoyl-CoA reductase/sulfur reductase-like enzyme
MRSVTIVGTGLAGLSSARALRAQSFDGRITLVGAEPHEPYDRPPLSKEFLSGIASRTDIALVGEEDEALDLDWRLGRTAVGLQPGARTVLLDDGARIESDGVILACGANARALSGPRLAGVHTLRGLDDALALRAELRPGAKLVVIGAGFIGAEAASTARALGVDVTVVEALPTPLAGALGTELGEVCAGLHAEHGVTLHTGVGDARIAGTDRVRAVRTGDGGEIPADVALVGIGAVPAVGWLGGSGLTIEGGVRTDERCATTIPGVVAVGDCACPTDPHTGEPVRQEHWTAALQRPAQAVAALLGREYTPPASARVPYFWSDQYGLRLQFAGHRREGDRVEIVEGDPGSFDFLAVYRRADRPVAVFAMNRPRSFTKWRRDLALCVQTPAKGDR